MDRLKGSLAHAIGRCFRRYNRNTLYHSDHIFHSHKGLGQGGLAVFPYHIACLLHDIRRACDGWDGHSDRVLIRITVYSYRFSGLAHTLKGGTPRCLNSLVKPRILWFLPRYFIRTKDWGKVAWPFFLITLPVYYMLFGVLAMDGTVILTEFL